MTRGFDEDEYRSLLVDYPPRPISDESELPDVEEHIWELLDIEERSPAQEAYLTLLSELVQRWEREHALVPPLTGIELIKQLLAERGWRHKDLVPVFGSESHVSDVLSGRRELRMKHVESLAELFHVSPAVFFPKREPVTA
jgi:HTH-type transcriptional regulator/antitoxin HigA